MRSYENSEIIDGINFVPEEILPANSSHVPVRDIVLASIAMAGMISVALVAPNAVRLFKYDFRYRVPETMRQLERQGYISILRKSFTAKAVITQKGRDALLRKKNALALTRYKRPAVWDGKWRFVIFDVKETQRVRRDKFRDELRRIGFLRVQNSVWVFPYECEEQ